MTTIRRCTGSGAPSRATSSRSASATDPPPDPAGRNFRSRAEILTAAAACIAHNPQRAPKALVAARGAGGRVVTRGFAHERDEAAWVAGVIADALAAGTAPGEVLVLARTAYATAPVQVALAAAGIPHRVLGSLGLYERAEVRDALAHLALLANPADAQAFGAPSSRRGAASAPPPPHAWWQTRASTTAAT